MPNEAQTLRKQGLFIDIEIIITFILKVQILQQL